MVVDVNIKNLYINPKSIKVLVMRMLRRIVRILLAYLLAAFITGFLFGNFVSFYMYFWPGSVVSNYSGKLQFAHWLIIIFWMGPLFVTALSLIPVSLAILFCETMGVSSKNSYVFSAMAAFFGVQTIFVLSVVVAKLYNSSEISFLDADLAVGTVVNTLFVGVGSYIYWRLAGQYAGSRS